MLGAPPRPKAMTMSGNDSKQDGRSAARKTALLLGGVALAIYLLFILSGVIGR
jgi:hypothetical protein